MGKHTLLCEDQDTKTVSENPVTQVVALIPAWNEEESIAGTIESLLKQSSPLDRIVVVVNNTTDDTAAVAEKARAEVIIMDDNVHKKAGALNYGLDALEKYLDESAAILVMDADTRVDPDFVKVAVETMGQSDFIGGVSSIFVGRQADSTLGRMQEMEYYRYRREIHRRGDRAFVLSGTASLIRWSALRRVKEERQLAELLPKGGSYYDVVSLTEDNELTLALLTLGYQCPAPGVVSVTDVMDDVKSLYHQRKRWYLGAIDNLWNYGRKLPWFLRSTYWRQQVGLAFAVITTAIIWLAFFFAAFIGAIGFSWFFAVLLGLHLFERTITVWDMGWRYRLISLSYIPELSYSLLLLGVYVSSVTDKCRGRSGSWQHT